jgi:hypothetical protein
MTWVINGSLAAMGPILRFLNIFAKPFGEKIVFLTQNKAKLCKILIITLAFEKNAIFRRKL